MIHVREGFEGSGVGCWSLVGCSDLSCSLRATSLSTCNLEEKLEFTVDLLWVYFL